jgi:hypothetical protein
MTPFFFHVPHFLHFFTISLRHFFSYITPNT